ncbi:MAG: formylglycine-generating enzyme family protein [Myxococcota bacterium]
MRWIVSLVCLLPLACGGGGSGSDLTQADGATGPGIDGRAPDDGSAAPDTDTGSPDGSADAGPDVLDVHAGDVDAETDGGAPVGECPEDFPEVGTLCGEGACTGGVVVCDPAGDGVRCSTMPGGSDDRSGKETCNGVDDDCDGETDEDFPEVGIACGTGACDGGVIECLPEGGSVRCSTMPGGSDDRGGEEVCDGLDNDCNGETDEDAGCAACGGPGTACPTSFCPSEGTCVLGLDGPLTGQEVWIPPGPFYMGCNEALDGDCEDNEYPQHEVDVPGFAIDRAEVTAGDWQACVDAGACDVVTDDGCGSEGTNFGKQGKASHPMNCVTWHEARAFCEWEGKRLPTEAEWEKAARGGCALYDGDCASAMPKYPWGSDEPTCDNELVNLSWCVDGTGPVGELPKGSSPYGLLDIAGNAWEMVEDCYHQAYDGAPDDGSAWIEPAGECPFQGWRVVRGAVSHVGSISHQLVGVRASWRGGAKPDDASWRVGFRCARTLELD